MASPGKGTSHGPWRPQLVGPGVLSTPLAESGAAFTPDGRTVYFTLRSPTTTSSPVLTVCVSHFVHGRWSEPEVVSFSGRYNDLAPSLSADGKRLLFTSDRTVPGRAAPPRDEADYDLWKVDRQGEGWSEPRNLGAPIDTPATDSSGVLAAEARSISAPAGPGARGASTSMPASAPPTAPGARRATSGIFRMTVWNQTIPDALRGRLAGIEMLSYMSGPLLGNVEAGLVAGAFGVRASVVSGGVLCCVGVVLCAVLLPRFVAYDARAWAPIADALP